MEHSLESSPEGGLLISDQADLSFFFRRVEQRLKVLHALCFELVGVEGVGAEQTVVLNKHPICI